MSGQFPMKPTTIAAIATPFGRGGIGIIKISGPDAVRAAASLFQPKGSSANLPDPAWQPLVRYFYYGHVLDPFNGNLIDEAMCVVMRAPFSYTGEDVTEIQAHGGHPVLQSILNLLMQQGVEMARPGEFTQRAFLNGRIDLSQAEAVMDMIEANSEKAAHLAAKQLTGGLKAEVQSMRQELLQIAAQLEAAIDFPEAAEAVSKSVLAGYLQDKVLFPIQTLLDQYAAGHFLREGFRIVIAGSPNVGKSSLMNCLLGKERSIVTNHPGTTRDMVEDSFIVHGLPVIISDTAGIHDQAGPVERIGIDIALKEIESADLVLLMLDASQPLQEASLSFSEQLSGQAVLLVLNKMDLASRIDLPFKLSSIPRVSISAKYHQGIEGLKEQIASFAGAVKNEAADGIVPRLRHKQALEKAHESASEASSGLLSDKPEEAIVLDVYEALAALAEITGESIKPDILERIFNQFCIGK